MKTPLCTWLGREWALPWGDELLLVVFQIVHPRHLQSGRHTASEETPAQCVAGFGGVAADTRTIGKWKRGCGGADATSVLVLRYLEIC